MTYFDAIILGILQGLTEFLPVSSSGHLVLTQALLEVKQPGVSFEVIVHLGTLVSVLVYFRAKLWLLIQSVYKREMSEERRIIGFLILGTIPAGLAGLLFKDFFESAFSSPFLTSTMLIVTGVILLATRLRKMPNGDLKRTSTILIGLGQAMAIMPGISRSGSTIAVGLLAGVKPALVAEFSFLLAIPAIGGAALLNFDELISTDVEFLGPYLVGAVCAFLTGLVAVYLVLAAIKRGRFEWFAYYCFAAGAIGLYLFA
ncbi:MAG: undecaprenyl-diphosphate phosphatase [candidate division Zixibacteria bacterium]